MTQGLVSLLRERYRDQLGRHRSEVTTPALLIDLDAARRNIAAMVREAALLGTRLRPHVKAHKCPELARLQLEAGAVGLTCATVGELSAMAAAGAADLLFANEVVDPLELRELATVARDHAVIVTVDDETGVALLEDAAAAADAEVGVVIEIDVGMGRAGVRTLDEAARLAEVVMGATHLRLRGVHGYEGHCMAIDDPRERDAATHEANRRLVAGASRVAGTGGHCDVVTGGGTGTFRVTGSDPVITDVQVGSYVLMDRFHERLLPGAFELASTVAATAISRHGSTVVLDVGRKSISAEFVTPTLLGNPHATVRILAEEHAVLEFEDASPRLGDRVEIIPSYAPTTVSLYDVFHVLEDGIVADIWPIAPRRFQAGVASA